MSLRTEAPNHHDAELALRLYDLRRETELRKARRMVGDLLESADAKTVDAVRQYTHRENAHFRQVTSYWEIAASFVNRGILHPDVFLDTCGEAFYTYSVLKPHVARIRESTSPRFMVQVEKIVAEHAPSRQRVEQIDAARAAYTARIAAEKALRKPARPAKKRAAS
jgi:hypothetical protein